MCGIYGYVGKRQAAPIILEGLKALEYRGYDSAGLAVASLSSSISIRKKAGRIARGLSPLLQEDPVFGFVGIGHTRWATHGPPTTLNAHPHTDLKGRIAVVHNGAVENFQQLRSRFFSGLSSETDTEVLAHLINSYYVCRGQEAFLTAVKQALREVEGDYAIAAICEDCPDTIVAASRGCPLLVGYGVDERFITSDISALGTGSHVVYTLKDGECVSVTSDFFPSIPGQIVEVKSAPTPDKTFPHETLREIHEQPKTIASCLKGPFHTYQLQNAKRVLILGCGSSLHAAMLGKYLIEQYAEIPVEVDCASEFRYRKTWVDEDTAVIVLSQSGETADSLAVVRQFAGAVLSICNSPNSTMVRESAQTILLDTGAPERGVAATKTFTAQVAALIRLLASPVAQTWLEELPGKIQEVLNRKEQIREIANKFVPYRSMFFLGRRYGYPTALEAALKMKELAYIHAEGFPAGEMKHGPMALLSDQTPCVFLMPPGDLYGKTISNLREVKARQAPLVVVAPDGGLIESPDTIWLPNVPEPMFPIVASVAMQLFAYYIAVGRGCDIDHPRNLAKSVTVE